MLWIFLFLILGISMREKMTAFLTKVKTLDTAQQVQGCHFSEKCCHFFNHVSCEWPTTFLRNQIYYPYRIYYLYALTDFIVSYNMAFYNYESNQLAIMDYRTINERRYSVHLWAVCYYKQHHIMTFYFLERIRCTIYTMNKYERISSHIIWWIIKTMKIPLEWIEKKKTKSKLKNYRVNWKSFHCFFFLFRLFLFSTLYKKRSAASSIQISKVLANAESADFDYGSDDGCFR